MTEKIRVGIYVNSEKQHQGLKLHAVQRHMTIGEYIMWLDKKENRDE